jgi:hypothetical protein
VILRIVLLVVLLAYGLPLAYIGQLGWRQRLSMAGRLGVRTPAAVRDYETFQLANRVAGLPGVVAGAVAVICGIAAFTLTDTVATVIAAVIGIVGAGLIARSGVRLGTRAAAGVPAPQPVGCGSGACACGSAGCAA